jgi:hypothetical protein
VPPVTEGLAPFLGGFTAAEGLFGAYGRDFSFAIQVASIDGETCELFQHVLGAGSVRVYERRRDHYDDEVVFVVRRLRDLVEVVVPFMDEHLPVSYKRVQYLAWREQLLDYWETRARRRRTCTIDGCDEPNRAHGLCRSHLWEHRRQ